MKRGAKPKRAWASREASREELARLGQVEALGAAVVEAIAAWHLSRYRRTVAKALRGIGAGLRTLSDNLSAAEGLLFEARESAHWTEWNHAASGLWADLGDLRATATFQRGEAQRLLGRLSVDPGPPDGEVPHHRRAAFEVLSKLAPGVARSDTMLAYWEIAGGYADAVASAGAFARRVDVWKALRRAAERAL